MKNSKKITTRINFKNGESKTFLDCMESRNLPINTDFITVVHKNYKGNLIINHYRYEDIGSIEIECENPTI